MIIKKYIECEKLIKALKIWQNKIIETYGKNDEYVKCLDAVLLGVDHIPAADVRPVVVCRDCKHNMANIPNFQDGININENWNACQLTELYDSVKPDDFCSHGVKREENK